MGLRSSLLLLRLSLPLFVLLLLVVSEPEYCTTTTATTNQQQQHCLKCPEHCTRRHEWTKLDVTSGLLKCVRICRLCTCAVFSGHRWTFEVRREWTFESAFWRGARPTIVYMF